MQITQVSTTLTGALQPGARTWTLDIAVGELPQRVFRQVLYLRFILDGNADGLKILPAMTTLRGHFASYGYDAKTVANPALVAQVKNVDNAVLVELTAPRQLTAVHLVNSFVPGASSRVAIHRVDGDSPVEAATTEAGLQSLLAGLTAATAVRPITFAAPRAAAPGGITEIDNIQVQRRTAAINVATLATDFTDARFALRLSNSATPLTTDLLAGLTVRSYPSAPRLGLAAALDPVVPNFFLRLTGEIGKSGDASAGQIDAGAALATALQQHFDQFFTQLLAATTAASDLVLPTQLTVALVLEADAPCQLQIDEFAVGYQLVRHTFPDRAEKLVLRFAGATVETQQFNVHLPQNATVTQATLTVAANLRADGLADPSAGNVLQPASLTHATAIHLGLERWAAQPFTPMHATTISGLLVGLLALTSNAQLAVALYADFQGQPTGAKLMTATLTLGQHGVRFWQPVTLPERLLLAAQPYWLLLKAVHGSVLWLAQAGAPAVQMLTQENKRWQTASVLANTQGLHHLLSPVVARDQTASLALQIAGVPVAGAPLSIGDRQRYDLTAALNAALTTVNALTPSLTFTTGLAGMLTVYPPEITYEE